MALNHTQSFMSCPLALTLPEPNAISQSVHPPAQGNLAPPMLEAPLMSNNHQQPIILMHLLWGHVFMSQVHSLSIEQLSFCLPPLIREFHFPYAPQKLFRLQATVS